MHRPIAESTRSFRGRYQQEVLPNGYAGWRHVALVVGVGVGVIATALWYAASRWQAIHFWVIPATVLIANTVEYAAHRGPMHHRVRGLKLLHLRHSSRHHRYFNDRAMHFESARDFHAVLFPPLLLLFFGAIAAALGALGTLLLPPAAAALFVATAMGYYLLYELLHFLYHVPPDWAVGRLPGVRWLGALHRRHHAPDVMLHRNFNLVFPLWDWLAGTLDTGATREVPLRRGAMSE